MPPLFDTLLGLIMAGESPPGVPRAVISRARYLGHVIPCARSLSTVALVAGDLYRFRQARLAIEINSRWLLTFDWDETLARAHGLSLDKLSISG